jgi:hypothetical protein
MFASPSAAGTSFVGDVFYLALTAGFFTLSFLVLPGLEALRRLS